MKRARKSPEQLVRTTAVVIKNTNEYNVIPWIQDTEVQENYNCIFASQMILTQFDTCSTVCDSRCSKYLVVCYGCNGTLYDKIRFDGVRKCSDGVRKCSKCFFGNVIEHFVVEVFKCRTLYAPLEHILTSLASGSVQNVLQSVTIVFIFFRV